MGITAGQVFDPRPPSAWFHEAQRAARSAQPTDAVLLGTGRQNLFGGAPLSSILTDRP